MFWISFYCSIALAEEPSDINPSTLWSNDQIVQESFAVYSGENLSLQSQIDKKIAFFQGESTFDSAFLAMEIRRFAQYECVKCAAYIYPDSESRTITKAI